MSIIGSTSYLTVVSNADRLANVTHKGQAHWATVVAHTCDGCAFFRPASKSPKRGTCQKAAEFSGGGNALQFPKTATACKYFSAKP